jgi:hypothetical protein
MQDNKNLTNIVSKIQEGLDGNITASNILYVCVDAMKIAEDTKLTGADKKDLVLTGIAMLLDKNGGDKNLLDIIPDFIDLAVSLSKGEINIKKIETAVCGCLGICSNFFCKKKPTEPSKDVKK